MKRILFRLIPIVLMIGIRALTAYNGTAEPVYIKVEPHCLPQQAISDQIAPQELMTFPTLSSTPKYCLIIQTKHKPTLKLLEIKDPLSLCLISIQDKNDNIEITKQHCGL